MPRSSPRPSRSNERGGRTTGPDLVRAEYKNDIEPVVFVFDERVNDDVEISELNFLVVDRAGNATPADSIVNVRGNRVVVNFGGDVDSARGASVNPGAVEDFREPNPNPNPVGTVGRKNQS